MEDGERWNSQLRPSYNWIKKRHVKRQGYTASPWLYTSGLVQERGINFYHICATFLIWVIPEHTVRQRLVSSSFIWEVIVGTKDNKGHTTVWGTALGTFYWRFSKKRISESPSNKQGFWDIYRLNPFHTWWRRFLLRYLLSRAVGVPEGTFTCHCRCRISDVGCHHVWVMHYYSCKCVFSCKSSPAVTMKMEHF